MDFDNIEGIKPNPNARKKRNKNTAQSRSAIPKKNQNGCGQRAASNSAGRKPGFKISVPSMDLMDGIYSDESPTRNSQDQAQDKVKRKRQFQKNKLAESPKQNGWINVDDDEDDEIDNSSTQGCFDGIPTDKLYDSKQQERVKQLKDKFGEEDDDSYTKAVKRSRNHRGNKHGENSLAVRSSPSGNLSKSQKQPRQGGGQRDYRSYGRANLERGGGRVMPSNRSDDPLDEVVSHQRTDRGSSCNDMVIPKLNVKGRRKKKQQQKPCPLDVAASQQSAHRGISSIDMVVPKLTKNGKGSRKRVDMGRSVVGQIKKWGGNTTGRTRDSSTCSGGKKKRSDSTIDVDDEDEIMSVIAAANQPKKFVALPPLGICRTTDCRVGNKTRKKQRANPGGKRKPDMQDEIMSTLDSVNDSWFHKYEATQEAVRIAIGRKVIRAKCSLSFCFALQEQFILFSFEEEGRMCEMRVYLKHHDLKEMKYHIANDSEYDEGGYIDCPMSVIAFRITPTTLNGLDRFADFYDKEETDESNDKGGRYITMEFQDTGDFRVSSNIRRMHCTIR